MDWNQLRTILWLRWRLTRNQWSRGNPINAVISIIAIVGGFILGATGGILGLLAGLVPLGRGSPVALLFVWDGLIGVFLFLWALGLIAEIQRSETIDIGRMLHLPVSLRQIFFLNYLASHLTFSTILLVPGMLGLCLGLLFSRGPLLLGLFPLMLGSVFMISAWTYCLRGWLVALMSNPRRKRTILALMTFVAIMAGQLPQLVNFVRPNMYSHPPQPSADPARTPRNPSSVLPREVVIAHQAVPFLWLGNGAMALAQGNVVPALWGSAALFGLGALGLRRAYRSTIRFYQGQGTEGKTVTERKAAPRKASVSTFMARRLPGLPEEAAAAALATLRSHLRAPEVKMMLAMNVLMDIIIGATFLFRHSIAPPRWLVPYVTTGIMAFACFGMFQLLFNQFGYDRSGFRILVLSPAPRRWILLGKNLALLPIALSIGTLLLVLVKLVMGVPTLIVLATILQLLALFFLLCTAGNLVSMIAPFRVATGSLKPTKLPAGTGFLIFLLHATFPLLMAPAFLAPLFAGLIAAAGWIPAEPANLLLSAMLATITFQVYRRLLPSLGRLLQQREQKILDIVTHAVE
jgi:ABC-2 type transport system permease protein